MDKEFLLNAQKIRETLINSTSNIQILKQQKRSKHNKGLFISKCALRDDIRHIKEQKKADEDGNIDHFHKNHKYNLIPLYKMHHNLVYEGKITILGFLMTDEGLKLHY